MNSPERVAKYIIDLCKDKAKVEGHSKLRIERTQFDEDVWPIVEKEGLKVEKSTDHEGRPIFTIDFSIFLHNL